MMVKRKSMERMRGSITLEAAMVLPLMMIGMFTIVMLMKVALIHDQIQQDLTEVAEEIASYGYLYKVSGLKEVNDTAKEQLENVTEPISSNDLVGYVANEFESIGNLIEQTSMFISASKGQVSHEVIKLLAKPHLNKDKLRRYGISEVDYSQSKLFYEDDMVLLVMTYKINIPSFIGLMNNVSLRNQVKIRGWTGTSMNQGHGGGGQSSDNSSEAFQMVYIFSSNQTIYHPSDCPRLNINYKSMLEQDAIDAGKEACKSCGGHPDAKGTVYATSSKYHVEDCYHIKPNATAIPINKVGERESCSCHKFYGGKSK